MRRWLSDIYVWKCSMLTLQSCSTDVATHLHRAAAQPRERKANLVRADRLVMVRRCSRAFLEVFQRENLRHAQHGFFGYVLKICHMSVTGTPDNHLTDWHSKYTPQTSVQSMRSQTRMLRTSSSSSSAGVVVGYALLPFAPVFRVWLHQSAMQDPAAALQAGANLFHCF